MNFLDKCNGVYLEGKDLTKDEIAAVESVFEEVLKQFVAYVQSDGYDYRTQSNPLKQMYVGHRCSLRGVKERLMGFDLSAYPIEAWVLDALRDCASADYYYSFEKDWS